ncbi:MAG: LD-carboxypeptidase [Gemmatimonadetes bacterium]|nr:LD-carboxypeptidase [Gemmatimonadota bacterium]MDE3260081.1 LD-carboxypeptidase [Gemmatimonadota bacterium]
MSPSGSFERERLRPGLSYLRNRGFRVRVGSAVYDRDRYLAGQDLDRANDLNVMFANPEVRAVFVTRGGFGAARVLGLLDYEAIRKCPKPLVGFSDTTAIQLGIYGRTGMVSYTGVTLCGDVAASGMPEVTETSLWNALVCGRFDEMAGVDTLRGRFAEGKLLGGCLSVIASLMGTGYMPDTSGALLFLEDVNEAPYRVDRMLTQLRMAGVFDRAAGVVFGQFEGCEPERDEEGTVDDVLRDFSTSVSVPVFWGLPYGHGEGRRVLPIGLRATVDGSRGTLTIVSQ